MSKEFKFTCPKKECAGIVEQYRPDSDLWMCSQCCRPYRQLRDGMWANFRDAEKGIGSFVAQEISLDNELTDSEYDE
jgi:hypothetical protein